MFFSYKRQLKVELANNRKIEKRSRRFRLKIEQEGSFFYEKQDCISCEGKRTSKLFFIKQRSGSHFTMLESDSHRKDPKSNESFFSGKNS